MPSDPDRTNYFTKHLFKAGLECPTKLYYKAESYPEDQRSLPFIEHAVYNKRLLKSLLRSAYPDGIFVNEDSVSDAFEQTQTFLKRKDAVLFDAVFIFDKMMAKLPVIERSGEKLKIFQIQTKAFGSGKHKLINRYGNIYSKWRDYLLGFAYQVYIISKIYPDLKLIPVLVLPDKKGESGTDNLHYKLYSNYTQEQLAPDIPASEQSLLAKIEVSEHINLIRNDREFAEEFFDGKPFENILYDFRRLYFDHIRDTPVIGAKCKQCEFRIEAERKMRGAASGFDACWRKHLSGDTESRTPPHVFDLIGPGSKRWIEDGVYDQRNITSEEITSPENILMGSGRISEKMRQALQIANAKGDEVPAEIMRPNLFDELSRWTFPIHFLDFEAGNYAVPVRNNRSPYHLVVFQFSCHTLFEDGRWAHNEWLDDRKSGYPSYELIRQLQDIPLIEEGTIVQYSNFERNALKIIRRELIDENITDAPELVTWIEYLLSRNDSSSVNPPYIADMSRLVKNFYYNNRMVNSLSIKDVLQSVLSYSSFLEEKYSKSYSSSNFDDIIWWQPNGNGEARNPYRILAESNDISVRRGTEAMVVYGKMISRDLDSEQMEKYRRSLLQYCELDTLAMLMIFEHWQQKLLNGN